MHMKIEYTPQFTRGILFLCTGNVFRSRTAAALARKSGIDAFSRGFDTQRLKDEGILEDMNYMANGDAANIIMEPDAYAYLKQHDVPDYLIETAPKNVLPKDFSNASIVVCMNYREHYPMMEKFRMVHNINPKNVMYWDIPDIEKKEGWKGFGDNLHYMDKNDILLTIKDKVQSLFRS